MTINEHYIKLTGKFSIPEPIEIGHNYKLFIEGSIASKTEFDNNDGTCDLGYKFVPIRGEIDTPLGKTIKFKDTRKMSQRLRGRIWMIWQESHEQMDFPEFYEKKMAEIINNLV